MQLLEKELHGALKMGHADLSGSGGSPAGAPLSDPAGTVMGEIEQAKLEISGKNCLSEPMVSTEYLHGVLIVSLRAGVHQSRQ